MDALADALLGEESCTPITKLKLPAAVGWPEITPEAELRPTPAGNDPPATDQEYGGVPPVATIEPSYASPTWPLGREVVEICSPAGADGAVTCIDIWDCADAFAAEESCTLTMKLNVAALVGWPEINPEAELMVSPFGRAPEATDHIYGDVPPVAARESR
jgi:hypothetical protein